MHRCSSSSHGNMVGGPCSCGVIHHTQSNSSFSMLFSMPNNHDHHHMYAFASPTSSSSVDCTLSLGTPSTRLSDNDVVQDDRRARNDRRNGSCVSNFCWDLLQPKHHSAAVAPSSHHHKNGSRGGNGNAVSSNHDPLLARRCANCDTTSTPLWRNGPRGPKSLCNACGIRFKKEERRATAAAANGASSSLVGMEASNGHMYNNASWMPHSPSQKMPCFSPAMGNEFRFMEDDMSHHENDAAGIPFLSWRLNVTDRPSLVHDFTR